MGPLSCFIILLAVTTVSATIRARRQTVQYTDEMKHMAQIHPGTKIIVGHAARYAPQDWPAWYTRTMLQWDGMSRLAPFRDTDPLYGTYHYNNVSPRVL